MTGRYDSLTCDLGWDQADGGAIVGSSKIFADGQPDEIMTIVNQVLVPLDLCEVMHGGATSKKNSY